MLKLPLSGLISVLCILSCTHYEKSRLPQVSYDDVKGFTMPVIKEPVFPQNTANITDFGAVSDGQTLNTQAIADAIEEVSKKGGGKVIIPRGLWLTGPIILKSNINLYSEEGALIIFSPDKNLYPLIETGFEGQNTVRCTSPIYGKGLENIAITGKGIFDGSGEAWRPVKKEKLTEAQWKELLKSGGIINEDGKIWYPSESYMEGQNMSEMNVPKQFSSLEEYKKIRDFLRPVMVSLVGCKKILLDGPVFQNSPAWCLHPLMCEDLTIRNVTVRNPWFSQNGDGLDIESCKNSIVHDCSFDVGDDGICIKSGKDADGRKRAMPTENLVIRNCIVFHGHGGVTIGSEMSGGVKNVYVSGCTFLGTDVGLRFKSNRGRGGIVENLYFTDIAMINIPTHAISFNLFYGGSAPSEIPENRKNTETNASALFPVNEGTPQFRNITIKNVICKGASQGIYMQGLPELNLQNIVLENIDIESEHGLTSIDVNGLSIKGIRLVTKKLPVLSFTNTLNVEIEKLDVPKNGNKYIYINGMKSKNITIRSVNPGSEDNALIGDGAERSSIKIL